MQNKLWVTVFVGIFLPLFLCATATAQGVVGNNSAIDHSIWQRILDRHMLPVEGRTRYVIDYQGFTENSRSELEAYIQYLSKQQYWIYPDAEQQAYWVNLYNALTVRLISDFYPIVSVDQMQFRSGSYLDLPLTVVHGVELSLRDIEHLVASSFRSSPTLHFAMSCGTNSCPGLAPDAYLGQTLQTSIENQMQRYLSDALNVRFEGNQLIVPKSVERYQSIHLEDTKSLLRRVAYYASSSTALRVLGYDGDIAYWEDSQISVPNR